MSDKKQITTDISNVVPVIESIRQSDGLFYALNSEGQVLFVTEYEAIITMYNSVPEIVQRQADIINQLRSELDTIASHQDKLLMEAIPCGSALIH